MTLRELQAIANRLRAFDFITRARRTEDNVIELVFKTAAPSKKIESAYFFDMTRGHSMVFSAPSVRPLRGYNAPLDTLLHTHVASARIEDVQIIGSDRILRIDLSPKSRYKSRRIALQFEFTGRNTNAILLDADNTVIEALRHIDAGSSFRVIRPGTELLPLPPRPNHAPSPEDGPVLSDAEIDAVLSKNYADRTAKKLAQSRQNKAAATRKQIAKFDRLLAHLSDPDALLKSAEAYQNTANILLANLHRIPPYATQLETKDFDGNPVTIPLPKNTPVNRMSDDYFARAKRAKAKARNVHIEVENLTSKRAFYRNILHAVEQTDDVRTLDLLVPKRARSQRKKERIREGELFWIDDIKVLVGRNSVENQHLLKIARANDIWMHVRGVPSSHVIIRTDKQNLPESVLRSAAKLCVDFSRKQPGDYAVDYTRRKFVKIQDGSRVTYDKYQTLHVRKEGIEIRT